MTTTMPDRVVAPDLPLPAGFRVRLDADARELSPDLWFGGSPPRIVRLTGPGLAAWDELRRGGVGSAASGRLARRLTDAGLAHPIVPLLPADSPLRLAPTEVTVVVPVLDRPAVLARCLAGLRADMGTQCEVVVVDDGSRDAAPVAEVARRFGARLVRREVNGGPGAARNTGLAQVRTAFVAFLDSDCVPGPGWLTALLAHLADPLLAAVAPRVVGAAPPTWAGRYTTVRGSLDLGSRGGRVSAGSRVSYVPTAALVVRRDALESIARDGAVFDPGLRVGEDVDLIWRLDAAGWRVRYEPDVRVTHWEPSTWPHLLARRYSYGTSAAPLARRHPTSAVPLVLSPWPALAVGALLARRPLVAAGAVAASLADTLRRLRRVHVPAPRAARATVGGVVQTFLGVGRYATQFGAPVLVVAAVVPGSAGRRLAAASLLLAPPVAAWTGPARGLDPGRFVLAYLADEIAYGSGVWAGCRRTRTLAPVRPVLARTFSTARAPTAPAVATASG